jgi:hypothetical protein
VVIKEKSTYQIYKEMWTREPKVTRYTIKTLKQVKDLQDLKQVCMLRWSQTNNLTFLETFQSSEANSL